MKKSSLILVVASSLLLASCDLSSMFPDGTHGSYDEEFLSNLLNSLMGGDNEAGAGAEGSGSSIKGDTSRTYLTNALETSFAKNAFSMDVTNFKVSALSDTYIVGDPIAPGSNEYALTKSNETAQEDIAATKVTFTSTNRNAETHAQAGGYFGMKGVSFVDYENGEETYREENQNINVYLKEDKYYYDYLNEQGEEDPNISEALDEVLDEIGDILGNSGSISMGTKGYLDLEELGYSETLDAIMPKTTITTVVVPLLTSWIDYLDGLNGVSFQYEGIKNGSGKFYTTTLKITDLHAIYQATYNMVDALPDAIDSVLEEEGITKAEILELLEEYETIFNNAKKFDLTLTFGYSATTLQKLDYSVEYQAKDYTSYVEDEEEEGTVVSLTMLDTMKASGNATFTFDDNLTITYPDFSTYEKVEVEAAEKEIIE